MILKVPPRLKAQETVEFASCVHLFQADWYLKSRSSCSILSPHEGKLNTYNYCLVYNWKLVLPFILKTTFNLWIHLFMLSIEFWYSTCACIFVNIFMFPSCPNRGTEMVVHSNRRAHWYTYTKRVFCSLPVGNVFFHSARGIARAWISARIPSERWKYWPRISTWQTLVYPLGYLKSLVTLLCLYYFLLTCHSVDCSQLSSSHHLLPWYSYVLSEIWNTLL